MSSTNFAARQLAGVDFMTNVVATAVDQSTGTNAGGSPAEIIAWSGLNRDRHGSGRRRWFQ